MTLQKRGVGPEDSVQHMLAAAAVHLGHEHPDTLIGRNNHAESLRGLREYQQAAALHRQTLTDRERILGPEHPHTLNSRNNLATVETALANASSRRPWLPLPPCTGECDVWAGLADGQRERLEAVGGITTSSPRASTGGRPAMDGCCPQSKARAVATQLDNVGRLMIPALVRWTTESSRL
ncbi:tetratricopeptide repeat protein [Streptomyces anulatus]|uniref:tetratricopeptide repeat protein n=1 Tax=Streptomyces anulatus TaxID=1892 RepID=UPI00364AE3E5